MGYLRINNLVKTFNRTEVVKDLTLEISKGS